MSRLSIVIPSLGGIDRLEQGLVSVLQNRPADCEVLVVLAEPYHDPYDLAQELTFVPARRGAGLVECLSAGLAASSAPIVHFLAAGWEVADGWADAALGHFADEQVASVVPLVIHQAGGAWRCYSSIEYSRGGRAMHRPIVGEGGPARQILGPDLRAAFYRRSALDHVGGLPRSVGPDFAAVDLALALATVGYDAEFEARSQVMTDHAPVAQRCFKRGLYAERLFWRSLHRGGGLSAFAAHGATVVAESLRDGGACLTHLLGRLVGGMQFGTGLLRSRQLQLLAQQAAEATSLEVSGATLNLDAQRANLDAQRAARSSAATQRRAA